MSGVRQSRLERVLAVPVLITTALNPPAGIHFLNMGDVATRKIASKAAVFYWATMGVRRMVIADATAMTLLSHDDQTQLASMGVEVEQISYRQDNALIVEKGKGRAEGELLNFAVNTSSLIAGSGAFFKCTGKVFCRNYAGICGMIAESGFDNIFWKLMPDAIGNGDKVLRFADLRFYLATLEFARGHLIPAYLKSDDTVDAICEWWVGMMLDAQLAPANTLRPLVTGFSGGSGQQYFDGSLGVIDAQMPCWVSRHG